MSTHNIGFYEGMAKIFFRLSSNTHIICSSVLHIFYGQGHDKYVLKFHAIEDEQALMHLGCKYQISVLLKPD